jgi:6-phosphofructokinase
VDEYGHPRFGGISGIVASEIYNKLKIEARAQNTGYYSRSGECRKYDRRLTQTLADKVVDLLLRKDYGQMPVLNKMVNYAELEEFHTDSVDMGSIGNKSLPTDYYNIGSYNFTEAYTQFLFHILETPQFSKFDYDFPKVVPED